VIRVGRKRRGLVPLRTFIGARLGTPTPIPADQLIIVSTPPMYRSLVRALMRVSLLSCVLTPLHAAGPGLGNLTYTSGENRTRISIVNDSNPSGSSGPGDGHGNVCMHDGYLATIYTEDGGGSQAGFAFWNVSNPKAPVRVANHRPSNSKLREPHGFGFTTGYSNRTYFIGQSTSGIQVWDWTDIAAPTLVRDIVLSGANSSDYGGVWWVSVQAPYIYVAGGDGGLYIVDLTNPASPIVVRRTNSQVGLSRINQVHAIGNLLIGGRVEGGKGISLMDISDPMNPVLRFSTTTNLPTPYASIFTGGKLYFASKGAANTGPARGLYVYNVNFDANNQPSGVTYVDSVGSGLGDGGYLSYQDGFIIGGFSSVVAKFDARTNDVTQVFSMAPNVDGEEDIDFGTVLGNVIFAGNDHGNGSGIIVHQTAPDTTGPSVNFVSPRSDAVNQNVKSRIGVTFTDGIDIRTLTNTTFIVRAVGGSALPGKYSISNNNMVNFSPNAPLAANTTYEIVVPAGGVKDFVGNTGPTTFTSRFSTGPTLGSPLDVCNVGTDTAANVGAAVAFSATLCSSGSGGVTYSWNFGDGTPATAFSSSNTASHAYATPGHYTVICTVRDSSGANDAMSRRQTIIYPVTTTPPTRSDTLVHDAGRGRISVVNSDAGTVASINAASPFAKQWEVPTGRNPRTLALTAANGDLWVVNQDDANIKVLNGGTGATVATIALPANSRPHGIAIDPAGANAYVSLEATGQLVKLSVSTRTITGTVNVGPRPRGIAISSNGSRIFVTRFISPQDTQGEVRELSASPFAVTRVFGLSEDVSTPSSESNGPGIPNYVQSVTITPDGRGAWVPSKKDNTFRGTGPVSDGLALTFESTVRTIVSKLDLVANTELFASRQDINNSDLASVVAFNARGDYAFVSTLGNNRIEVVDALSHTTIGSIENVGRAPDGLAVVGNLLFVHNFLSRDVAVYNITEAGGTNAFPRIAAIVTQSTEPLSAQILEGKRIFHNSADPRMSREAYISCASCHLDGDSDGRVWDFTQRGEGLRNTIDLLGRGGVSQQGPVHWTGNFDEIQDFENDIRNAFGGTGFMTNADFTATSNPLGAQKAGRSAELDALAAYVTSLRTVHNSPFRNANGSMTADAIAGKALFESTAVGCASCHSGAQFTDSALNVFRDVGTITAASGRRNNQTLTGFDTPSLIGVWETAPYLHDGSAVTLLDVITTRNPSNLHGSTSQLTTTEQNQLVAYLRQLDNRDVGTPPPQTAAPTFSPGGGTYTSAQSVTISSATSGASIRYTTDGSTPSATVGTVYAGPVTISATTTLRAIAYASGLADSSVSSAAYTINTTPPPTLTWEAESLTRTTNGATATNDSDGSASGGSRVTLNSSATGSWIQFTLPNVPAGTYSIQLAYKSNNNRGIATFQVNGAAVGGTLDQYASSSSYPTVTIGTVTFATTGNHTFRMTVSGKASASSSYTLSADKITLVAASAAVATPTFSPGGGTFTSAQSVTISSTTSGAAIRYTTDGSTPSATVGTVYSGPVTVSATTTLRAIAYASGMTDSNVASATYTITTTPPPTLTWEAESLTRTTNGATASNDSDGSASGGSRVTLNSSATGSWMQFTLPNVPAGTYSIQLAYKSNGNRGIATFQVDGVTVGSTLNQYASSSSYPTATIGTVTIATTGNHTFRMTVSGKASASSSYTLSADKITLVGQ
jgi:cytochrome c peroxidase